jgi:UDP:flavonoid glycosyltransferase YjiC (YdhE family)
MSRRLRVMVGAVGLAGHALPAIALSRELRARGHEVLFCGFSRWRAVVEDLDMRFVGGDRHIAEGLDDAREAGPAEVARALGPTVRDFDPDVVVGDALSLAPSLAAEVAGIPRVTLYPEVYPVHEPGLPFFSLGLLPPRTALGAAAWRASAPVLGSRLPTTRWLRRSRADLDEQRRQLGLAPYGDPRSADGDSLSLVATFPQLEYPRAWPPEVHVTGPMVFDLPGADAEPPPGDAPLVLIAPSTVKDPSGRLIRTALEALGSKPLRLLVTMGGAGRSWSGPVPPNAVIADWVDYSRLMREASLVICHGTHGTVVQALVEGVPLVVSPAMPDDAEHGARVAWSGAGLMIPSRLAGPGALRTVSRVVLSEPRFRRAAEAVASWARTRNGCARGAELIERHVAARPR